MALSLLQLGDIVALGYDSATGARGLLTKCVNGTGGNSVLGSLLSISTTVENSVKLQSNEFDTIGICAESGIANGQPMWIWKPGSRCQVLYKDGVASTVGYVCLAADTDGRATEIDVPSANPVVAEHFKEIGHVCESKSAGSAVLVLVETHYN